MILCGVLRGSCVGSYRIICGFWVLLSLIVVFRNGLFRDLQKYKLQILYVGLTGIFGGVLQGSLVGLAGLLDGSFRDLWWGYTGIFGGVLQGSLVGSYRVIC
jgi:hypothetical protein